MINEFLISYNSLTSEAINEKSYFIKIIYIKIKTTAVTDCLCFKLRNFDSIRNECRDSRYLIHIYFTSSIKSVKFHKCWITSSEPFFLTEIIYALFQFNIELNFTWRRNNSNCIFSRDQRPRIRQSEDCTVPRSEFLNVFSRQRTAFPCDPDCSQEVVMQHGSRWYSRSGLSNTLF